MRLASLEARERTLEGVRSTRTPKRVVHGCARSILLGAATLRVFAPPPMHRLSKPHCSATKRASVPYLNGGVGKVSSIQQLCEKCVVWCWHPLRYGVVKLRKSVQGGGAMTRMITVCERARRGTRSTFWRAGVDAYSRTSRRTDYIDLCGEPEFMQLMTLKYHEEAQAKGVLVMHACAFGE